jgi:succinate dehydrogenase / fumarate reductase flavoprotein subunit
VRRGPARRHRLGGNSLSDLIVFGQRSGQFAAQFAKDHGAGQINTEQVESAARRALEPFDRGCSGENPFAVQHELQEMMQDLVGIVRREEEKLSAIEKIEKLKTRAARAVQRLRLTLAMPMSAPILFYWPGAM